jgi:putative nucleotidyltransferase with HDIG domain
MHPLPRQIAGIDVPRDEASAAAWRRAQTALPEYLFAHSVRSYCWATEIARREGWTFDPDVLWTAALFHDVGLARLSSNTMCFEVEGAEIARRFLERHGMDPAAADRAAIAIILHMQPNVTLADGVESVLLDRATGIDVRGAEIDTVERVRDDVIRAFPRGSFDRWFIRAIRHEAASRPTCQSAAFVRRAREIDWPARTPWAAVGR